MAAIHNRPMNFMRDSGNFRVVVQRDVGADTVRVYILETRGNTNCLWTHGKNGEIVVQEVKEGSDKDERDLFLLKIPGRIWDLFAEGVSETSVSVKPEEVSAELKATKYHLEDMRKLVFTTAREVKIGQVSGTIVDSCTNFEGHHYTDYGICTYCGDHNGPKK